MYSIEETIEGLIQPRGKPKRTSPGPSKHAKLTLRVTKKKLRTASGRACEATCFSLRFIPPSREHTARHHPPASPMEIDESRRVAGRVHAVVRLRRQQSTKPEP